MPITIDDLCRTLELPQITSREEYTALAQAPATPELDAFLFDVRALPSTRPIVPIVCKRLARAKTALELGCGAGFRLLYYAMNNQDTQFTGIERDAFLAELLKSRLNKLHVLNVRVIQGDYQTHKEKYGAVLGIDCFEYPKGISMDQRAMLQAMNIRRSAQCLDESQPNPFFCTPFYDAPGVSWTGQHYDYNLLIAQKVGLSKLDTEQFSFKKFTGEKWTGRLLFYTR